MVPAPKAETSKGTSEVTIPYVWKETGLRCQMVPELAGDLKSEETLKKDRPKPSASKLRKRGAEEIRPQKVNAPKRPKPETQRGEISRRSWLKPGARRPAVSYTNAEKSIRLAIVAKLFPMQISLMRNRK